MSEVERYQRVKFAIYYNKPNPHVFIHKIGGCACERYGGDHEEERGGWGYFVEEYEAKLFAVAIGKLKNIQEVRKCKDCKFEFDEE